MKIIFIILLQAPKGLTWVHSILTILQILTYGKMIQSIFHKILKECSLQNNIKKQIQFIPNTTNIKIEHKSVPKYKLIYNNL